MGGGEAIGSFSMLKMLAALFFVVGLIFVTAWLFRRLSGARLPRRGAARPAMRMAGTLSLGERRFLAVVEVEQRRFLLGVAPQAISMLVELEADAGADGSANTTAQPPAGEFAKLLEKARQTFKREGA